MPGYLWLIVGMFIGSFVVVLAMSLVIVGGGRHFKPVAPVDYSITPYNIPPKSEYVTPHEQRF